MAATEREKQAAELIKRYAAGTISLTPTEIARKIAKEYALDLNPLLAVIEPADGKMFMCYAGLQGEHEGIKYSADPCIGGSMKLQVGDRQYLIDAKKVLTHLFERQYPQFGKQTPEK